METILYKKTDTKALIEWLKAKEAIAFPTDTVFGLACIMDEEAIRNIYRIKGRSFSKPLPVMCNNIAMMEKIAYLDERARKIAAHFFPGALTMVLKKKENIEDYVTMGKETIGIRIPDDDFILDLIGSLEQPLMVTSANISGNASLLKWEDVYECMKDQIAGIVTEDARGERASTILDLSDDIRIIREGPISLKEIEEIL